jgi:hypothetical protein
VESGKRKNTEKPVKTRAEMRYASFPRRAAGPRLNQAAPLPEAEPGVKKNPPVMVDVAQKHTGGMQPLALALGSTHVSAQFPHNYRRGSR